MVLIVLVVLIGQALVWKLFETGRQQAEVAGIMGWSRGQVSQYAMLKQLSAEAWRMIATTFEDLRSNPSVDDVASNATTVAETRSPFSEYILRDITSLTPAQQLELVRLLVKDPKAKADYRKRAERYRARNALTEEAGIMGWSRGQVAQYAMLRQISPEAWRMIATTFEANGSKVDTESVAEMLPVVATPFSERILRDITALTPAQQLELVRLSFEVYPSNTPHVKHVYPLIRVVSAF